MTFDDVGRLRVLADYRVLHTAAEEAFDNLAKLTAKLFETPIALVTLMGEDRQWFKAKHGLEVGAIPREYAFCEYTIRADATLMVPDTWLDPRFSQMPVVVGDPKIRFYCGVPLRTPEGHALGTVCLMDHVPRSFAPEAIALLEALARQVELELEIHRRLCLLEEKLDAANGQLDSKDLMPAMIVHDMRGPLTAIMMLASSIKTLDSESAGDLDTLLGEAERLRRMLADILDVCLHEAKALELRRRIFSIAPVKSDLARRMQRVGLKRGATILVEVPEAATLKVDADPELVLRLLENLVNNAIHHAVEAPRVTIAFRAGRADRVVGEVSDRGRSIPEEQRSSIFEPLTRGRHISSRGGYGLGLSFCRLAVEAHDGSIGVRPNTGGEGNTFFFDLPRG